MLRNTIIERMKELDINTNQLCEMMKDAVPRRTLYDFISKRCDTSSQVVSAIMEQLGLGIKKTKPKSKNRSSTCKRCSHFNQRSKNHLFK
jgi:hypothetical protein